MVQPQKPADKSKEHLSHKFMFIYLFRSPVILVSSGFDYNYVNSLHEHDVFPNGVRRSVSQKTEGRMDT